MNRRSLLTNIVVFFSAVTAIGFSYPFFRAWFPMGKQELSLDLDLEEMSVGEVKLVSWLGRNVYIVRRPGDVEHKLSLLSDSREDPESLTSRQPDFAKNTIRARRADHLVVYANCTHLGCEVQVKGAEGFDCPCHRSRFDAAGRVEQGAAARMNLEVPHYDYVGPNAIRLKKV